MVKLSDLQLDVMDVLWERGEATVADVHQALAASRGLAYTTVATLLTRLEDKGVARRRREGRQLCYRAHVTKDEVQRRMVARLVDQLFQGDPAALVSHLLGDQPVQPGDLERIRELLNEFDGKDQP